MFDLAKYGGKPCLEGNGQAYTYEEVHQQIELIKPFLVGRSLILCLCENTIPSLTGYIAFVVNGQVPILLDGSQKPEVLLDIIKNYAPEYIWTQELRLTDLPSGKVVYRLEHYVLLKLAITSHHDTVMNGRLQLLLTTSGSTGSSKFVRLTRANLEANAASIIEYLRICADDVAVTTLPFSYSFGLSIINTHLLAGASIQLTELTPLSRDFWELVQQKNASSLSGVPYTFDMLKRIKFERFELSSIRYLSQAGGKMTQDGLAYLQQVASKKGWSCYVMYGQTEATARMSYLPVERLDVKLGSIGRPIPGGKFSIVNEDRDIVDAPFIIGELVYTGPNVAMGYAINRVELACNDDWNGQLYTGDLAYRDEDGFYYITGRLKRFLKIFGNRVSLDEVETLLQGTFKECEFICFGQDDYLSIGYIGEIIGYELVAFVSLQFSIHRTAIKCIEMAEIPRLSNGKVNFGALPQ